jgi:hypothetical protein
MTSSQQTVGDHYLAIVKENFQGIKTLGEKALAQLSDADYHWQPDGESNSIAIIIKHMSGNMISRWTDLLTSDGEKPTRHRDEEFIDTADTPAQVQARWQRGWACLFEALDQLQEPDLLRVIYIRAEPHTVIKAINRQLIHYSNHVGQIIYLAKHRRSQDWQSLSIARGKSGDYLPK